MNPKASVNAVMTASLLNLPLHASGAASPTPNRIISRNCPAYSSQGCAAASAGNDGQYSSFFQAKCPDFLAYDLSGVPEEERRVIDAVWYCTSSYDMIGMYQNRIHEPSDYTLEINKAPGGIYPEDGWETAVTVEDNTLASRQHVIAFAGCNWIRMRFIKADGMENGLAAVNLDIHNVSDGVSDSWLFLGDSITACGMNNCYGTGFATHISRLNADYFPVQENGGIGGLTSADGLAHIERWLSAFPGQFVSIAYGTNDVWSHQVTPDRYYANTAAMLRAVLGAGKKPVLPTIPYAANPEVAAHLDAFNAKIRQLYSDFPEVIPGPDLGAILAAHPEYLSADGVHPCAEGYEEIRRIWAETMFYKLYQPPASVPLLPGIVNAQGMLAEQAADPIGQYPDDKYTLLKRKILLLEES